MLLSCSFQVFTHAAEQDSDGSGIGHVTGSVSLFESCCFHPKTCQKKNTVFADSGHEEVITVFLRPWESFWNFQDQ